MRYTEGASVFPTLQSLKERLQGASNALEADLGMEGCPCFEVVVTDGDVHFDGHCWRVCFDCEHCGVHITASNPPGEQLVQVATLLKEKLDAMDWYGRWEIKWGPRSDDGR